MASVPEIFETMAYGPAPEGIGPVSQWLDGHGRRFGLFIGGSWVPGAGETFETLNPATGKPLVQLAQATSEEIDRAVRAARGAQPEWWALGGHGRARYLYAIARQIQKHSRFFAVLESLDNGKPIRESRDIDVPLVSRHFYHHADLGRSSGQRGSLLDRHRCENSDSALFRRCRPWRTGYHHTFAGIA